MIERYTDQDYEREEGHRKRLCWEPVRTLEQVRDRLADNGDVLSLTRVKQVARAAEWRSSLHGKRNRP